MGPDPATAPQGRPPVEVHVCASERAGAQG